ncbi:uncharacterized protein LOC114005078 [Tupaia chinensis]|uniref:uncharacterized protein LOC114005078 n=1 Tax=Tupaia chinensis TaxID=246437 RepID=UPI000FFB7692|nr:uncharacterized protein LOC114005078 [Tupaia chinensis]
MALQQLCWHLIPKAIDKICAFQNWRPITLETGSSLRPAESGVCLDPNQQLAGKIKPLAFCIKNRLLWLIGGRYPLDRKHAKPGGQRPFIWGLVQDIVATHHLQCRPWRFRSCSAYCKIAELWSVDVPREPQAAALEDALRAEEDHGSLIVSYDKGADQVHILAWSPHGLRPSESVQRLWKTKIGKLLSVCLVLFFVLLSVLLTYSLTMGQTVVTPLNLTLEHWTEVKGRG